MDGLKSVTLIFLAGNKIDTLTSHHFNATPNLRKLDLSRNFLTDVHKDAFCHKTLNHLDLSLSGLKLTSGNRKAFACIPNLQSLILNHVSIDQHEIHFQNLANLERLQLLNCRIFNMSSEKMFQGTRKLELLDISNNPLNPPIAPALSSISKTLKRFSAANCKFTQVTEEFLPRSLWNTLTRIDLSANIFTCDCRLAWFVRWMNRTNVTIVSNKVYDSRYQCYSPTELKKKPLRSLAKEFQVRCFLPPPDYWLDVVIVLLVVAVLSSALGSLLHRFRWHVRYWRFVYEVINSMQRILCINYTLVNK